MEVQRYLCDEVFQTKTFLLDDSDLGCCRFPEKELDGVRRRIEGAKQDELVVKGTQRACRNLLPTRNVETAGNGGCVTAFPPHAHAFALTFTPIHLPINPSIRACC